MPDDLSQMEMEKLVHKVAYGAIEQVTLVDHPDYVAELRYRIAKLEAVWRATNELCNQCPPTATMAEVPVWVQSWVPKARIALDACLWPLLEEEKGKDGRGT